MSFGQGSIGIENKNSAGGAPFPANSAENGTSVDGTSGAIVLGNDFGAPGDPGQLLSTRFILDNDFQIWLGNLATFLSQWNAGGINFNDIVNGSSVAIQVRGNLADITISQGTPGSAATLTMNAPGGKNFTLSLEQTGIAEFNNAAGDGWSVDDVNKKFILSQIALFMGIVNGRTGTSRVLVRRTTTSEVQEVAGASGSFTTTDGKTVTVTDGIITAIV